MRRRGRGRHMDRNRRSPDRRAARRFGAQVVLTSPACSSRTERCHDAVAVAGIDAEIIVNLQGDAPLTPPLAIEALLDTMVQAPGIAVATPMIRCSAPTIDRLLAEDRMGRTGRLPRSSSMRT